MPTTIRLATEEDAAAIGEIYAPFCRGTAVSFEVEPPSLAEMQSRIAKTRPSYPWLVAERDGAIIGYAYASKHRERAAYIWSVDVSAYIAEGFRAHGYGRALYTSLFSILRLQGFFNANAGITLPNPGSEGLHRSMGFQPIGVYRNIGYKCGGWHDVAWYQLALRDSEPDPRPPRDMAAVMGSRDWDGAFQAGAAWLDRRDPDERRR